MMALNERDKALNKVREVTLLLSYSIVENFHIPFTSQGDSVEIQEMGLFWISADFGSFIILRSAEVPPRVWQA